MPVDRSVLCNENDSWLPWEDKAVVRGEGAALPPHGDGVMLRIALLSSF